MSSKQERLILRKHTHRSVEECVSAYKMENPDYTPAEIGFIRKNNLKGLTGSDVQHIIEGARKLAKGALLGCGDDFNQWCIGVGRVPPSDSLIDGMNEDPAGASLLVVEALSDSPTIYKSYCTYLAGRRR